jgi:tetratricopeptide (TPR) repeat protein
MSHEHGSEQTTQGTQRSPCGRFRTLAACLFLAGLSIALYWNTLENDFVIDDVPLVKENTLLRSRQGAVRLLHSGYWEHMKSAEKDLLYRPVTMLSFALDYAVSSSNPMWYHAINVLLNALVVFLVFSCVASLSGRHFLAFITAGLFAILPCHVEAVTLVVGRAELLSAFFGLCAWLLHMRGGRLCFLFSLSLIGLAVLSKENAIVFPLLILAGDFVRPRLTKIVGRDAVSPAPVISDAGRTGVSPCIAEAIRRFLGYGAVMGLCMAMRYVVLGALTSSPAVSYFGAQSRLVTWLTMGKYFFELYFRWLILGTGMNPACTHRGYANATAHDVAAWAMLALLIIVIVFVVILFFRRPSLPVYGALFFFIAIAPVANFFIRIAALAAVRFLYLPSIGYCLAVGCLVCYIFSKSHRRRHALAVALGIGASALFCAYTWLIADGTACFKSEETVYRCILRYSPRARFAMHGMALALSADGRRQEALALLECALRQDPEFDAGISYTLGLFYTEEGRLDEAERLFREAQEKSLDIGMLSDLHVALGNVLHVKGDLDGAKLEFLHAAARNFDNAVAHNNLANICYEKGRLPLAERHYRIALELNMAFEQAWQGLGTALVATGLYQAAINDVYNRAANEPAWRSWAFAGMGRAFMGLGDRGRAEEALLRSLEVDKNNLDALTNLSALYLEMNRFPESVEAGERALQAGGQERPEVIHNLAAAYESVDRLRALIYWKRFVELAEADPMYAQAREAAKRRIAGLEK